MLPVEIGRALHVFVPSVSADGEWQRDVVARTILEKAAEKWSERRDLNSRPPVPQTGALTGLRYAPMPR
jgi:hypothetical protein